MNGAVWVPSLRPTDEFNFVIFYNKHYFEFINHSSTPDLIGKLFNFDLKAGMIVF